MAGKRIFGNLATLGSGALSYFLGQQQESEARNQVGPFAEGFLSAPHVTNYWNEDTFAQQFQNYQGSKGRSTAPTYRPPTQGWFPQSYGDHGQDFFAGNRPQPGVQMPPHYTVDPNTLDPQLVESLLQSGQAVLKPDGTLAVGTSTNPQALQQMALGDFSRQQGAQKEYTSRLTGQAEAATNRLETEMGKVSQVPGNLESLRQQGAGRLDTEQQAALGDLAAGEQQAQAAIQEQQDFNRAQIGQFLSRADDILAEIRSSNERIEAEMGDELAARVAAASEGIEASTRSAQSEVQAKLTSMGAPPQTVQGLVAMRGAVGQAQKRDTFQRLSAENTVIRDQVRQNNANRLTNSQTTLAGVEGSLRGTVVGAGTSLAEKSADTAARFSEAAATVRRDFAGLRTDWNKSMALAAADAQMVASSFVMDASQSLVEMWSQIPVYYQEVMPLFGNFLSTNIQMGQLQRQELTDDWAMMANQFNLEQGQSQAYTQFGLQTLAGWGQQNLDQIHQQSIQNQQERAMWTGAGIQAGTNLGTAALTGGFGGGLSPVSFGGGFNFGGGLGMGGATRAGG